MKFWISFAFVCSVAYPVQAVPLLIIAGQSNAAGQAPSGGLSRSERASQSDILYYRYNSDGLQGTRSNQPVFLGDRFGPEYASAEALAAAYGGDVAMVKVAVSGTPLATASGLDWAPTSANELYDRLITEINAAQSDLAGLGETAEIAAIFWMQGEQDAKSGNMGGGGAPLPQPGTANSYESNLNAFIQSLRSDLSAPTLPFLIGQINIGDDPNIVTNPDSPHNTPYGEWDYTPTIQAAQQSVADSDPHAYLVPTTGFSQLSDYLHFDVNGQKALGNAFASTYLAIVPEPATLSLLANVLLICCGRACSRRAMGR